MRRNDGVLLGGGWHHAAPVSAIFGVGASLYTASADGACLRWRWADLEAPEPVTGPSSQQLLAVDRPRSRALLGPSRPEIRELTGQVTRPIERPSDVVFCAAFGSDGQVLACGMQAGAVAFFDVSTGACIDRVEAHLRTVAAVRAHPDGDRFVSVGWDGRICVISLSLGEVVDAGRLSVRALNEVALLDRAQALVASADGHLVLWQMEAGEEAWRERVYAQGMRALAVSADGAFAATLSAGAGHLFRLDDRLAVPALEGEPTACGFCDGRFVVGYKDGAVRAWERWHEACFDD